MSLTLYTVLLPSTFYFFSLRVIFLSSFCLTKPPMQNFYFLRSRLAVVIWGRQVKPFRSNGQTQFFLGSKCTEKLWDRVSIDWALLTRDYNAMHIAYACVVKCNNINSTFMRTPFVAAQICRKAIVDAVERLLWMWVHRAIRIVRLKWKFMANGQRIYESMRPRKEKPIKMCAKTKYRWLDI